MVKGNASIWSDWGVAKAKSEEGACLDQVGWPTEWGGRGNDQTLYIVKSLVTLYFSHDIVIITTIVTWKQQCGNNNYQSQLLRKIPLALKNHMLS